MFGTNMPESVTGEGEESDGDGDDKDDGMSYSHLHLRRAHGGTVHDIATLLQESLGALDLHLAILGGAARSCQSPAGVKPPAACFT